MHSRRNRVSRAAQQYHRRRSPLRIRRGLRCSQRAGESRGEPKAHSKRSAACRWRVPGARQGTGSRRGSLHPPWRQGAFRPLQPRHRAQPAHRPTLRAPCGMRVDCLRSRLPPRSASLRVVAALRIDARGGKRSSRHRSGTCKTHLIATQMHPSPGYARQGPPGTSGKLSAARKLVPQVPIFPP